MILSKHFTHLLHRNWDRIGRYPAWPQAPGPPAWPLGGSKLLPPTRSLLLGKHLPCSQQVFFPQTHMCDIHHLPASRVPLSAVTQLGRYSKVSVGHILLPSVTCPLQTWGTKAPQTQLLETNPHLYKSLPYSTPSLHLQGSSQKLPSQSISTTEAGWFSERVSYSFNKPCLLFASRFLWRTSIFH